MSIPPRIGRQGGLVSEERLHVLLPKQLKRSAQQQAKRLGLSVGEYVRRLIESDLRDADRTGPAISFPFGERPIHTGRTRGSIDHDRLA